MFMLFVLLQLDDICIYQIVSGQFIRTGGEIDTMVLSYGGIVSMQGHMISIFS